MEHIKEEILEQFLFSKEELTQQQTEEIELHLKQCSLCTDLLNNITGFYKELNTGLSASPNDRDKEFAERLLPRKSAPLPFRLLKESTQSIQIFDGYTEIIIPEKKSLVKRFVEVFKIHPVKTTGSLALSFGIIALLFMLAKSGFEVQSPAYAKIENQVLKVFDTAGQLMWTKITPGIPDVDIKTNIDRLEKKYLFLLDIDEDGVNELLLTGNGENDLYTTDTLYCFEHDGRLRWKAGPGRTITFGEVSKHKHSTLRMTDCITVRVGDSLKLFVIAREGLFSLSKLFEIDPATGKEKQSYFNRGGAAFIDKIDLDADGEDEIIFSGINDSYNNAFAAIFDPKNINGYAPVTAQHLPLENVRPGREKYYVLLPKSKIWELCGDQPYNNVKMITHTGSNKFWIYTVERVQHSIPQIEQVQILYLFGEDMKVLDIAFGDNFIRANDWLLEQGMIKESLIPNSVAELKSKVLYWEGDKFVNTPTMNKHYKENSEEKNSTNPFRNSY